MDANGRIALGVEYDGTDYLGWQIQSQSPTVQEVLERALSKVADAPIAVVCAGRTDSGVHGQCQVVHFDPGVARSERSWVLGANANLPVSVAVRWASPVDADFHARFSARARSYRYSLLNRWVRPALGGRYLAWDRRPLQLERMREAIPALLGEHDFSAFRTVHCQAPSPIRTLHRLTIEQEGDQFRFDCQANAFLHHMVRNLVGSLMVVGRGEQPPSWIAAVLASGDRRLAGPTAPSSGLCFIGPRYPRHWGLPAEVCLDD